MTPLPGPSSALARKLSCRSCEAVLDEKVVDLGVSPLANRYLAAEDLGSAETFYPLHLYVCAGCLLVQLEELECPQAFFDHYPYFSSYSDSWLAHARGYVAMALERFELDEDSRVLEVASNDGYLLQYFRDRGVPILGVEPARNVGEVARLRGIPTIGAYFGEDVARRLVSEVGRVDLLVANNVLAHVPNLNDFVQGLRLVLQPHGVLTLEFPHLLRLIQENQFDTIYHEHLSYFSFLSAERLLERNGLTVFDVEELSTHGGSLRVFARREDGVRRPIDSAVRALRKAEKRARLDQISTYRGFESAAQLTRRNLLRFLIDAKEEGRAVAGYGAPAKGNTLLNYCGVRTDLLEYTVDLSPHKQGRYLPGTRIPIYPPERLAETQPDYVLILPWNLREEIAGKMAHISGWGGQFVVPVPRLEILTSG